MLSVKAVCAFNELGIFSDKPEINMTDKGYVREIGESVTFTCGILASPPVTSYFWSFTPISGTPINVTGTTGKYTVAYSTTVYRLTVTGVDSTDTGFYECIVVNIVGISSEKGSLAITGGKNDKCMPTRSIFFLFSFRQSQTIVGPVHMR